MKFVDIKKNDIYATLVEMSIFFILYGFFKHDFSFRETLYDFIMKVNSTFAFWMVLKYFQGYELVMFVSFNSNFQNNKLKA